MNLDDLAIDWGRIETWCEISSGKAICGPVLDRVKQAGRELEQRVVELEEALTITLEMLPGLAEQQAMPDDWWKPNAERAHRILEAQ